MKPQTKLLIKLGGVLLVILLITRLTPESEYALAGESVGFVTTTESVQSIIKRSLGNEEESKTETKKSQNGFSFELSDALLQLTNPEDDPNYHNEDLSYLYTPEYLQGCEEKGYQVTENTETDPEPVIVVIANKDGSTASMTESDPDELEREKAKPTPTPTPTPAPTPTPDPYEGMTKEEWEFQQYRKTQEYFNSLLVTNEKYYNEEVVKHAEELATLSEEERHMLLLGTTPYTYTPSTLPAGFRSSSQAAAHMATIDVPVWKMDAAGNKYSSKYELTVHELLVDSVRTIFSEIYMLDMKFPYNHLIGFMFRKVGGSGMVNLDIMSTHAFGVAIDINHGDYDNDMYVGKGNDLRNRDNPYCIPDEVIDIFAKYGWNWGGNYEICSDTMHFQYFSLEYLQYDTDEPFPILYYGMEDTDPVVLSNLQKRLFKLGFLTKDTYKTYNKTITKAVKAFQKSVGLEEDGIVDYETWVPLINATHDMEYVF